MNSDIAQQRLYNQYLSRPIFKTPRDVVGWFGAVQAQDYPGALWAVALRMENGTQQVVEKALAERTIVRSWPMRGTLHFTLPEDLPWMLKLLSPRIISKQTFRFRELELDDETFKKSRKLFINALKGGNQLTRGEMMHVLESGNVSPAGQRGIHILGKHALDGLICFGARQDKQQTFTLLDDLIPDRKNLSRDGINNRTCPALFPKSWPCNTT